jgi:hypothetical protein
MTEAKVTPEAIAERREEMRKKQENTGKVIISVVMGAIFLAFMFMMCSDAGSGSEADMSEREARQECVQILMDGGYSFIEASQQCDANGY